MLMGKAWFIREKVPRIKGVWINERFSSVLMLALLAIGYAAERGRRV